MRRRGTCGRGTLLALVSALALPGVALGTEPVFEKYFLNSERPTDEGIDTPQDQTFEAGHSIGLLVQGSNTVWAVPDDPGAGYTLRFGKRGSSLVLPLAP